MRRQHGSNDGDGWHHGDATVTTVVDGATAMATATVIEGAMTMRR
jgi:hypothetical protein